MRDKVFLDTNILIYMFAAPENKEDARKSENIRALLAGHETPVVSIQILNETANVFLQKKLISGNEIVKIIKEIIRLAEVVCLNENHVLKALELNAKYKISFYDALVVSAALTAKCTILFTEDMHHGLLIEKVLKVINPFK